MDDVREAQRYRRSVLVAGFREGQRAAREHLIAHAIGALAGGGSVFVLLAVGALDAANAKHEAGYVLSASFVGAFLIWAGFIVYSVSMTPYRFNAAKTSKIAALSEELERLTTTKLEIRTGTTESYYQHEQGFDLLRVSLHNLSGQTIRGVRVVLKDVEGYRPCHLPVPLPLKRMHDNGSPPCKVFDLPVGIPVFLDFLYLHGPEGSNPHVFVAAHHFGIPQARVEAATNFDARIAVSAEEMATYDFCVHVSVRRPRDGKKWVLGIYPREDIRPLAPTPTESQPGA